MVPRIISVDDHVVEPPNVWLDRLPAKYRARAPRLERVKGTITGAVTGGQKIVPGGPNDQWADQWVYDDLTWPLIAGLASIGPVHDIPADQAVTYDQIVPGCFNN